jgi:hypothetical protein
VLSARSRLLASTLVAVTVLLVAGIATASGARSEAHMVPACKQWNVTGTWPTSQGFYHVTFHFVQTGTTFTGTGTLSAKERAQVGYTAAPGKVKGTLKGSHLVLTGTWIRTSGAPISGRYVGTVSKGAVKGTGRDITTPGATAVAWSGKGPTKCVTKG